MSERILRQRVGERPVASVHFAFWFTTWSRDEFQRLRGLFERLPPGASLSPGASFAEEEEKEKGEPEGTTGAYAPVHDFEGRGSGAVRGSLDAVLTLWHALRGEELVKSGAPRLVFEDSAESTNDPA